MKIPSRILSLPPAALLAANALLLGGCANLARNPPSGGEILVVETENVWMTGSNIPVRVPKSPTARIAPTISPLTVLTPDEMRRGYGPGTAPMH